MTVLSSGIQCELGMTASMSRIITQADIVVFSDVTGDRNPVHLDPHYAAQSLLKGIVAHGMLTAAGFSALFGTELPGPGAVYISQTLHFRRAVRPGDCVHYIVKLAEFLNGGTRGRFDCVAWVGSSDRIVLEGEAILLLPRS